MHSMIIKYGGILIKVSKRYCLLCVKLKRDTGRHIKILLISRRKYRNMENVLKFSLQAKGPEKLKYISVRFLKKVLCVQHIL